ncbi:MAG: sigma-54-dependent Fis family transcriptional regulator [Deltaproteobacteria bacterium]|nr:sigma-54-dependent Fis family transcriptional regulator [Deltaproteobacteria bacterium]MBW2053527.1 sigma-54-dependent Fis family transcriptional regulator [Deltaproteobacteria bacterium]MBW2142155.1 sigma-54-dependent Fis family transcriptional regulator [Deltaproteobacteria bacterium]MBW2324702.1 sigma-54-dependent Fis family transcriptional regulator [Deltaproteobacteria bacterium]
MQPKETILVVEDDDLARKNLEYILTKEGHEVVSTSSGAQALSLLEKQEFNLVLTDLRMKHVDGMQVLNKVRTEQPHTEVIMITAYATVDSAVEAMRHGAYYYISKPYKIELVRKVVREALLKKSLYKENIALKEMLAEFKQKGKPLIVGTSEPICAVNKLLKQVAPADSNVLIVGETGTGKELAARTIHNLSLRKNHNFVAFNCGSFTEELLANELFGHEKDAFTGATSTKIGLIEAADKGTVFLDEIVDMPMNMQAKLLRVIEEKEVLRVGGTRPIPVNVRFLAATARDLLQEVEAGRFRQDLYYRLNVVTVRLPPLADRLDDIALLIHHFLIQKQEQIGKEIKKVDPQAMDLLLQYSWPGNVRELENIIERAMILAQGHSIRVQDLPEDLWELSIHTFRHSGSRFPTIKEQEIKYIKWVLEHTAWNKTKAAEILGINRASLWRKMKRLGLEA